MGANRVTLRGRFVEIRALASSSRGVDGSTGNDTLFYLSNEPKSARFRLGLPELGLGPPQLNPFRSTPANWQVRMLGACFELHRRLPTRSPTKLSSQRVGLVSLDCVPCQNSEFSALFTVSIFPWPESSYRRQKRSAVLEADGGGHGGGHGPAKWPKT